MKHLKVLSAIGLLALTGAAQADVTSSIAVVSDYDFRGFTQTKNKPALQLSLDYAHASGWYIGTWGSNIDFNADELDLTNGVTTRTPVPQTEIDLYTGFKGTAGDFGWDAGLIYYTYNGNSDLNFAEIYGKMSYKIFSAGLYYSNDFGGKAYGTNSDDAIYVSTDLAIPAGPLTIGVHGGYSTGDGIETAYFGTEDSYFDYGLGVSYTANNMTVGIKWVGKDAGSASSDDRIVLSLSTALPWK